VFNPREIWLVVVLVCALSFAGFVATRLLGQGRGLLVAGLAGGIVSSTAVTHSMAQRSRETPSLSRQAAAGAVLASCVMSLRVIFFGATINAGILPRLAPALIVMALAGSVMAILMGRAPAARHHADRADISNPFSLKSALVFAIVYSGIVLGVRAAQVYLGQGGIFLMATISGFADVDAVTIALARQGPLDDGWKQPAAAVTLATVVNNLFKAGLAAGAGGGAFRRLAAWTLIIMSALGAACGAIIYMRG